jgi:hypothetical protein
MHNIQSLGIRSIFPTELIEYQLDNDLVSKVLEEISIKREEILDTYIEEHPEGDIDVYYTDYTNPAQLNSIESILEALKEDFNRKGLKARINNYWVAAYRRYAEHSTHNHREGIQDTVNFSGIIYLSNIGQTNFYSDSISSTDYLFKSFSNAGKIIMFPSTLLHSVPSHNTEDWRYVVSFNASIYPNRQ